MQMKNDHREFGDSPNQKKPKLQAQKQAIKGIFSGQPKSCTLIQQQAFYFQAS
jgi:hypothetical protein